MNEFTISVTIADRPYRLTITREDEEIIRKAAQTLNNTIKDYSSNYAFNDKQDLLAMAALEYATNSLKKENELTNVDKELAEKIKDIDMILTENLKID